MNAKTVFLSIRLNYLIYESALRPNIFYTHNTMNQRQSSHYKSMQLINIVVALSHIHKSCSCSKFIFCL